MYKITDIQLTISSHLHMENYMIDQISCKFILEKMTQVIKMKNPNID